VEGPEIVARTDAVDRLRPIPLARYMRLREDALRKHMEKLPGEYIQAREIIASTPVYLGTLRRIYRAPGDGRLASLQGTWVTLDLAAEPFQLRALYRGTVTRILPHRGVVIETVGALLQCAWGIGEGSGPLKVMVDSPNSLLLEERMDSSVHGAVLLAGNGATNAALRRAAEEHAAGLIVGSLRAGQKELVMARKVPTLVTEGFGERAMSAHTYQLLASHAGDEVVLDAALAFSTAPPEVFIPAKVTAGGAILGLPPPPLTIQLGARVRIIAEPHAGAIGKISAFVSAPQVLENGVSARGAEIELNSNERVFVPWENFELVDG